MHAAECVFVLNFCMCASLGPIKWRRAHIMSMWLGVSMCVCLFAMLCVNLFVLVYYNLNHIYVLLQQTASLHTHIHTYNINMVLDIFMFICM